jgi:hypothetical protein
LDPLLSMPIGLWRIGVQFGFATEVPLLRHPIIDGCGKSSLCFGKCEVKSEVIYAIRIRQNVIELFLGSYEETLSTLLNLIVRIACRFPQTARRCDTEFVLRKQIPKISVLFVDQGPHAVGSLATVDPTSCLDAERAALICKNENEVRSIIGLSSIRKAEDDQQEQSCEFQVQS